MPGRHTTEFPECFLNAGTERFKRFGKAQRHAFDVAVRQHAVKECVVEVVSGDFHIELITDREVTGRQSPRVMILIEEDGLPRAMQTSPLPHAALKCATCGIRKPTGVTLLQPFKQRLRPEPWFHFQTLLNGVPHISERVTSRAIRPSRFLLRRQCVALTIFACSLLTHFRHPC
jgi:hypothetical protein